MLKVFIYPDIIELQINIQEDTIVRDILESIQDKYKIEKNVNYWTCYSQTKKKVLNHKELLQVQVDEEEVLHVYLKFQDDFSNIIEISNLNKKTIKFQGEECNVEINYQTKVQELFEFIAKSFNIEFSKISQWTSYSDSRKKFLQFDQKIGNFEGEILYIYTNQQKDKQIHHINQQVFNQDYLFYSKTITLTYTILDSNIKRNRTAMFLTNSIIEDIAKDTLQYCSLTINQVSVDIFIDGIQYNNIDKRSMTIDEINLQNDSKITAAIRWID